jgi:nucleoside-diphosphate-sugar epimerase
MRILILGASGVLGRATLPHLGGHEIVGTTALGARTEVCDVYDAGAVERVARACAPEIVVNFLTDLIVLRFGRFWGPGTWADVSPEAPAIHIAEAGRRAAELILTGAPGAYVIADPAGRTA